MTESEIMKRTRIAKEKERSLIERLTELIVAPVIEDVLLFTNVAVKYPWVKGGTKKQNGFSL